MNTAVGHNAPSWLCIESSAYFDTCGRDCYDNRTKHGKGENKRKWQYSCPVLLRLPDGSMHRVESIRAAVKLTGCDYNAVRSRIRVKGTWTSRHGVTISREERTA